MQKITPPTQTKTSHQPLRVGLFGIGLALAFATSLHAGETLAATHAVEVAGLRCEYLEDPLGIDVAKPRLSWKLQVSGLKSQPSMERGIKQSAYQILVASTPENLAKDQGDLWDSGKVVGDRSIQVEYVGKPLESGAECHWKVRVWEEKPETGNLKPEKEAVTKWSKPALWTMGLLKPDDWTAKWIGYDADGKLTPEEAADEQILNLKGLGWHQAKDGKPGEVSCFRKTFELPADRKVRRAVLVLYAYHFCEVAVNGTAIGSAAHWERTARLNATKALHSGKNVITLAASHTDPYPPAVVGKLVVQFESGPDTVVPIDKGWKAAQSSADGWQAADFDDSSWSEAQAGGYTFGVQADLDRVPASYLRKNFEVGSKVKRAMVYVTALGAYELRLNGKKVGEDVLTPGWTEFRKRVHYQTYDVTGELQAGGNTIGAILGDGWYASNLAHLCRRKFYGGNPRFLAQLVIEWEEGTKQVVATDSEWKASYGPIRHADLQLGCEYDSLLEMPGWDKPDFNDRGWNPVACDLSADGKKDVSSLLVSAVKEGKLSMPVNNMSMGGDPAKDVPKVLEVTFLAGGKEERKTVAENSTLVLANPDIKILKASYGGTSDPARGFKLEAAVAEPSKVINELPVIKVTEPRPGCWTFDLGQNMVGWVRLKVRGEKGQRITVRHGEMLNRDGTIYTAALRSCPATDFFILSGGEQVLEPHFTFHGFRYVEIRGLTSKPDLGTVTGVVVHSAMNRTGNFESSHLMLNQLFSNIIWGQKGNYLEVPTDCPQRDERMGWTGDAQFFIPTAAYNFDVAGFFTRWLETCEDNQSANGTFPHVVPDVMGGGGATAWGDAPLICTYNIYRVYGDTRIIAERFASLDRYMQWLATKTKNGISSVGGFGDWLNAGGSAKKEVIDTAYHAYLAQIMSEMAAAIGRQDDAARYAKLHEEVKAAFVRDFQLPDGSLKESGQTGYALAFSMGLVPAEMCEKATEKFVEEIKRFNWHLATGFIGTPRLLPALNLAGRNDVAYRLLLNDTYPSWLFSVKNGATTMWERWNGWTPEGFGDISMNSYNHYAFGAVGEYLYGTVGGIQAEAPGYKTCVVKPVIGDGLTWAKTSFDSIHGRIVSNWKCEGEKLTVEVTIPPNTRATIFVPAKDAANVTESGKPAAEAEGVKFLRMENGAAIYAVGSGTYQVQTQL